MVAIETYSRRQKRLQEAEQPEVYTYDIFPEAFRIQVIHILRDALGPYWRPTYEDPPPSNENWQAIYDIVTRELGKLCLMNPHADIKGQLEGFIQSADPAELRDTIGLAFLFIEYVLAKRDWYELRRMAVKLSPADAIEELNTRFRDHALGFRYERGQLIRIDSELVHAEIVKPALALLTDPRFKGADEEFREAHKLYREGDYKNAIVNALKPFESTLKAICEAKGWPCEKGARATDLLKVVRANGLFPDYLTGSFEQLIGALSAGLPKIRNEDGAHGQGSKPKVVPGYVAALALNLAAAKIVFLVDAMKGQEQEGGKG